VHVILAEDDQDDQLLFCDVVNELEMDISITVAETAPHLLAILKNYPVAPPPHFIFLEMNFPGQLPFQSLKEIRSNSRYDRIVIIMFCTSELDHEIDTTYENGANLYMNKDVFYKLPVDRKRELFMNRADHLLIKPRDEYEVKPESI
jgi:PleD family two-component response regulator